MPRPYETLVSKSASSIREVTFAGNVATRPVDIATDAESVRSANKGVEVGILATASVESKHFGFVIADGTHGRVSAVVIVGA